MKLNYLFKENKPVLSFEIFPPKKQGDWLPEIYDTIDALAPLGPDFISVTYGASGSSQSNTVEIASLLQKKYSIPSLAHLTCVGDTDDMITNVLTRLKDEGIQNILALRGDLVGDNKLGDFKYASELTEFIKNYSDFCVAGACYPEVHPDAPNLEEDIKNLKIKADAGAEFFITQLFFDNATFYEWRNKVREAGITTPIVAGVMPITSAQQLKRMATLCGATIPENVKTLVEAYEHNAYALRQVGIAYATQQILDLLANGVDGIHLYTMNKPHITKQIMDNIRGPLYSLKGKN
ncbi:MAG: methylenetetrahydrofolate reductase [NAD(P)H] [Epulopiscium sp. Nele67-Bin004]|nr:MAG: methylenetetrahydrofolate reductase [NAD(P)H] [Epulopiscium sp. Nele67-Bin004]